MELLSRIIRYLSGFVPIVSENHLDFGCGPSPRNPFNSSTVHTVDIERFSESIPTKIIKPGDKIPFDDNYFDSVSAYDVLEHLSREHTSGNQYIFYMNELHRVLKPGGIAVFIFPFFPKQDLFADPTHVNFIPKRGLSYFVTNGQVPGYAGVTTDYKILKDSYLRIWKFWVNDSLTQEKLENLGIRRRLSLGKRTIIRFLIPSHRIWILQKK